MASVWREPSNSGSANQFVSRISSWSCDAAKLTIVNCRARRPWCKAAHCCFPENAAGTRLMTLWFVFALMTAAAIFAVLLPLGLGGRLQSGGREAVVYSDQLQEIDRDVASGLIGKPEAEAARVEIGRRLLAVADQDAGAALKPSMPWRRAAAALALVGLPLLAVAVYLPLGSPRLGDFPLALRSRAPAPAQPLEALVTQVEQHLEK